MDYLIREGWLVSVLATFSIINPFPLPSQSCQPESNSVTFKMSEQTYDPTGCKNPESCHFNNIHFCLSEYMICFSTRSAWPVKQHRETEHCGMLNNSITLKDLCKIVYKIASWGRNNCHIARTRITGI
jgi:hypothetical protein